MNTGLPTGIDIYNFTAGLPFLLWRSCVALLGTHIPLNVLFAASFNRSHNLDGYTAPFPHSKYKAGVAKWPLMIPVTSHTEVAADMIEARKFLSTWNKPSLIAFSDEDPITRGANKDLRELIPGSKLYPEVIIRGGGHFLQVSEEGAKRAAHRPIVHAV